MTPPAAQAEMLGWLSFLGMALAVLGWWMWRRPTSQP